MQAHPRFRSVGLAACLLVVALGCGPYDPKPSPAALELETELRALAAEDLGVGATEVLEEESSPGRPPGNDNTEIGEFTFAMRTYEVPSAEDPNGDAVCTSIEQNLAGRGFRTQGCEQASRTSTSVVMTFEGRCGDSAVNGIVGIHLRAGPTVEPNRVTLRLSAPYPGTAPLADTQLADAC